MIEESDWLIIGSLMNSMNDKKYNNKKYNKYTQKLWIWTQNIQ